MSNPFVLKIEAKNTSNPFVRKAKISISEPTKKPNPFAAQAQDGRAKRLAELDRMIAEAQYQYEESLTKALKSGVNKQQVKKLFDISDRRMSTLLNLCALRKRTVNGNKENTWKAGSQKSTATSKKAKTSRSKATQPKTRKMSNTQSKPRAQAPKKANTREVTGRARHTRRHH